MVMMGKAMLYVVLFEDNPEISSNVRPLVLPQHLDFLDAHADQVKAAGPLSDETQEVPRGGLWLVEAENEAAVRRLILEDPFWATGLRQSVQISRWTRVFAEGRRTATPTAATGQPD